jgi:hypothetical protein
MIRTRRCGSERKERRKKGDLKEKKMTRKKIKREDENLKEQRFQNEEKEEIKTSRDFFSR